MNRLVLGGVIGPFVFSAVVILSAALREDYSHIADFISDLGATGSPRATLMNVAGFIPGGLGLVAFGAAWDGFCLATRSLERRLLCWSCLVLA